MEKTGELELTKQWEDYKIKFKKNYPDKQEDDQRKELFKKNLKFIEEHNEKHKQGLTTFTVGVNHFSDMTEEEKKNCCGALIKH